MKRKTFWRHLFCRTALVLAAAGAALVFTAFYFGIPDKIGRTEYHAGDVKVACVGDSITHGLYLRNWFENNYPRQLDRLLGKGYCVWNFGASSRTAMESGDRPYGEEKIFRESLQFQPDAVVIMFGTNDAKDSNWRGKDQFIREYEQLIATYRALPGKPTIYLCTPATAYDNNYGINTKNVETVSEAVKEIAAEENLQLIDVHAVTKGHGKDWFGYDGIHPSVQGAAAIAAEVSKVLGISSRNVSHTEHPYIG